MLVDFQIRTDAGIQIIGNNEQDIGFLGGQHST